MGVLDDLRSIDDQSREDELQIRRDYAKPNYTAALKSGALDMLSGFQAALGKSGFESGSKTAAESAALAPPTPELYDTLTKQGAGAAVSALGPVAAASVPQLGLTLGAGALGLLSGPFAPIVSPSLMMAANLPYWYGKNLIGQSDQGYSETGRKYGIKKDYEDLSKVRAATLAVGQSAADALVSVLFPAAKIIPGTGRSLLARMSKGFLGGVVEEATAESAQEAMSIINEQPELKALFTPQAIKRMTISAEYGGGIGGPIGAAAANVTETPSLHRDPADVAGQMKAKELFTPGSMAAKEGETVLWMRPEQLLEISGYKGKAPKTPIFKDIPVLDVRDDGAGGKAVISSDNLAAAAAMAERGVSMVPVRINGLGDSKFLQWNGKPIDLELKPYTGKGTAKSPVIARSEADLAPARARAARGKTPGYVRAWDMDIAIHTPKGGLRKGENDGQGWTAVAPNDYGEVKRGEDADGEPMDMWIGPDLQAKQGYVIEQIDPATGAFQEHKVMAGFKTSEDAVRAYDAAFADESGPGRRKSVTPLPMSKIKAWAETGTTAKPISEALKTGELPVTADDVRDVARSIGIDWAKDPAFMQAVQKVSGGVANLDILREPSLRRLHEMLARMRDSGVTGEAFTNPIMISWEATPSPNLTNGHLNPKSDTGRRTDNHEYTDAVAYHNMIEKTIRDSSGRDRLAKALGIEELVKMVGPGWWKGQNMPATQQQLALSTSGYTSPSTVYLGDSETKLDRLTPIARNLLSAYAAARGLASKQDAVGWHHAIPVEYAKSANGLDVQIGEPVNTKQMNKVMAALAKAKLDDEVVPIPTPFGVRLFRQFTENGKNNNFDPKWAEAAQKIVEKVLKPSAIWYNFVDGGVIENDWTLGSATNAGQAYTGHFNAVATTDARRELGSVLSDVEEVEREEAKRRGLGFDEALAQSIYPGRQRNSRPPVKRPASIPLGGLDPSPASQEEVYKMFGKIGEPGTETDTKFYDLKPLTSRPWNLDRLLDRYGFRVKYFSFEEHPETGVKWRTPDLNRDGYRNGTLWIYDPRNGQGSFFDPEYTNTWRIPHELGHAVTEDIVQRKYGDSKREGRLGRAGVSYRGAPGKTVEIEVPPLTLKEAQRAVEWEDLAFRTQRMLLEEAGVKVEPHEFGQEYNANLADAVYRVLSGDFGDPGKRGFDPYGPVADLKGALQLLEDAELKLAADQGRPPTKGVDLDSWRQIRDDELIDRLARARSGKKKGNARESERLGLKTDSRYDTPEDMLPGIYSPIQKALIGLKTDVAQGSQWKAELLKQPGVKAEEIAWTGIDDWLDMFGNDKLTKSDVLSYLKDKTPQITEHYYGALPKPLTANLPAVVTETPPAVVENVEEEEEAETPELPEFDQGDFDMAEITDDDRREYADGNIDDALNSRWSNRMEDPDALREMAQRAVRSRDQIDKIISSIDDAYVDGDTWTFDAIENAEDEPQLRDRASDLGLITSYDAIEKQLELPGMERSLEERLPYLKGKLNELADKLFRDIHNDHGGPDRGGKEFQQFETRLAENFKEFLARERAEQMLGEDDDDLRDKFNEHHRDDEYENLKDDLDNVWEDHGPRIWRARLTDHTEYEIRETSRDGGRFEVFVDGGDIGGTYRSFQAAEDAAQGHAMDAAGFEDDGTTRPQTTAAPAPGQLPPQSEFRGPSKWGSRSLKGGKNYGELVIAVGNLPGPYSHSHFGGVQGNTMHIRKQDFSLPNLPGETLMLTEIQSDLYSAGSGKKGAGFYQDKEKHGAEIDAREKERGKLLERHNALNASVDESITDALNAAAIKSPTLAEGMKKAFATKEVNKSTSEIATAIETAFSGRTTHASYAYRDIREAMLHKKDMDSIEVGSSRHEDARLALNGVYRQIGRRAIEGAANGMFQSNAATRLMEDPEIPISVGREIATNKALLREAKKIETLTDQTNTLHDKIYGENSRGVPDKVPIHPWGKAWFEFAIKRMLKWAAERDYNYIALPTAPLVSVIEQWGINASTMNEIMAMTKEQADEYKELPDDYSTGTEENRRLKVLARQRDMVFAIGKRANEDAPRILKDLGKKYDVRPVMIDKDTGHPVRSVKGKVTAVLPIGDGLVRADQKELVKVEINGEVGVMRYEDLTAGNPKFDVTDNGSSVENDVDTVEAGHKHMVGSPEMLPFFYLKKNYGNGIWVLPITPEVKEGFKKPLPGYCFGGLVRAA